MSPLELERIKKIFPCKQDEVYKVADLGWQSCLGVQPAFFAHATIYTVAYIEQQRAAIVAAQLMPDYDERYTVHQQKRVILTHGTDDCCIWWRNLESHLLRVFPDDQDRIILVRAGLEHYKRAAHYDWEFVTELMKAGNNVMNEYSADLLAGGMPADFQSNYNAKWNTFEDQYNDFKNAEQEAMQLCDAKMTANNEIYKNLMEMFKDGRKIYRHDAAMRKRFTFSYVLELVSGNTGGNTPAEPSVKMKFNMKSILKIVNLGWNVNGTIHVGWNDGTEDDFTGDGSSTSFFNKTYTLMKIFIAFITGAISSIVELHINDSNLSYFKLHKSMKELKELILQNNLLPTKVVDQILVDTNKLGTSGPDRVLNLIGNEPPSAKGLAAKAELESRGWVVLVS